MIMEDLILTNNLGEKQTLGEFLETNNIKVPTFDNLKTVGELIESLSKYPKDMKVKIDNINESSFIDDIIVVEPEPSEKFLLLC